MTNVIPFLLEDAFKAAGVECSKKGDWQSYTVRDGLLLIGQNPASSEQVAKDLLQLLQV